MDEEEFYKRFGRMLRRLRKKVGVSQLKLAESIGLSRTSVTNIERGRQRVQLHTLYSIAEAIAQEPPDLLPAMPRPSPRLNGMPFQIEKLSPDEKSQLEGLGMKEEQWLGRIAAPVPRKPRRQ